LSSESEIARLKDENARLRDENRDLRDQNKNLRDNKELLEREIVSLKIEIEKLKRQIEALLEEKKREMEARRARKGDKKQYLELLKKSLLNKVAPDALPTVLLETELNVERCGRRPAQAIQKPKLKAFVEFEKQRTAYYTHYIAHPCPYCMPTHYGCPIHGGHHAVPGKLTEQELNTARVMLQSDNTDEQAKGLRTLFFHAQADDRCKQFIEEKYPGMDVEGIIKGQDFIEFAMQLTHLLSGYQKSRESYVASMRGSGIGMSGSGMGMSGSGMGMSGYGHSHGHDESKP
jgi:cell division protein FtsB